MIKYNNVVYDGYLDLLYKKARKGEYIDIRIFPTHTLIYCRAALEAKFNRKFKLAEVRDILEDTTWQTSFQTPKNI